MDRGPDELTELALAGRDGDAVAVGAFARATYRDIWRLCAYLDHPGTASDLTQEVYVRALRALPAFRGECSAKTWLMAIARRTVTDAIRSRGRRHRLDLRAAPTEETAADPAGLVELHFLLAQLDDDRRTAFVLTQAAGLTYAEAAQVCGCAVGTIRSRVARARAALVEALELASA